MRRDKGLRVSGPNCMGSLALRERLLLYPAPRVRSLPAGDVGIVFQSGGTFQFWLQQAALRGLDFSYAVSSGNELDLDMADYINFSGGGRDDPHHRLCMVEGVRRPEVFMAAAEKALAAGKPLLVLKLGVARRRRRRGEQATRRALAGDDAVFDAVCRKYGVLRCPTLDDLIEGCLAFGQGRLPRGRRIAIAGFSGGAKGLLVGLCQRAAGRACQFHRPRPRRRLLPASIRVSWPRTRSMQSAPPLASRREKFSEICRLIVADPNVDLFVIQGQLPLTADDKRLSDGAPFTDVMGSDGKAGDRSAAAPRRT